MIMDSEFQANDVALRILKERCEYLQQRLNEVEEENYKLKQERLLEREDCTMKNSLDNKTSCSINDSNNFRDSCPKKQIILLNQQKLQMSHQIKMLTIENQSLWSQLSKFMPYKENLKQNLCLNPDNNAVRNNNNSEVKEEVKAKTSTDISNCTVLDDNSKESLEEISLKLINGIIMGKLELENQYSQMIDLQKDGNGLDLKSFTYISANFNERSAVNNLRSYIQKLKDFRKILFQHKKELSNAITDIKNSNNRTQNVGNNMSDFLENASLNTAPVNNANKDGYSSEISTLAGFDPINNEDCESIKVCPMCCKSFSGKFKDFYVHVTDHFEDDNQEYVDANTDFAVVP